MRQSLEEILMAFFMEHESESFFVQEISEHFGFTGSKDFKILVKQLADLEDSGKIVLTRQGKFGFNQKNRTLEGTFRLNDKGFGFVTVEEGKPDIFIPRTDVHGAMDGDTVAIRILQEENPYNDKAASGTIVKIIERAVKQVVGIYTRYPSKIMMQTGYCGEIALKDSKLKKTKCYVTRKGLNPVDGTVVIAEVDSYETERHELVLKAHIVKEIGYKDAVGMDILMILHQLKIPTVFPDSVIEEANRVSDVISPEEIEGRVDLRQELTVTIDGADAKDLDDAVALVKREDGTFVLTVSIADVSYYVTENSEMDKEAFERGTSVYLTDRVVPMLPQRLSNGICSLHPYEERLTLTSRMEIDRSGTIYQHEIFPSVIQSNERLTYDEVNVLFNTNEASEKITPEIEAMLWNMKELHTILERRRMERGAIDFDTQEAKILVDEKGAPTEIVLRERGVAERLIESFMLAANETVARHYEQLKVPFIYRIHENPDSEKLQRFLEFITAFGITIKGKNDSITPKKLQKALNEVRGEPYEAVVSTMMLRSMKQAKYDITPTGHYGLAAEDYTHFTSPIRRYPDLIVHRMIRHYGKHPGHLSKKEETLLEDKLQQIADQSSRMERLAVQAERDVNALKKAEYMQDKVGEEFDGIVSSVTKFGMFVELANTVEGLIHISHLKQDYFNFIESHMILLGERTGVSYRIGDRVRVKCVKVDVEAREVDFLLVEDAKLAKTERPRKGEFFDEKSSKKGKKSKGRQRFKKAIKTKKKRR